MKTLFRGGSLEQTHPMICILTESNINVNLLWNEKRI